MIHNNIYMITDICTAPRIYIFHESVQILCTKFTGKCFSRVTIILPASHLALAQICWQDFVDVHSSSGQGFATLVCTAGGARPREVVSTCESSVMDWINCKW